MSRFSATFLASQVRCSKRKPRGRRWTMDDKLIALSIYKRSPKSYNLLRTMFSLPNKSTLIRLLQGVPFETGINKNIFDTLSNTISHMDESDRICSLMFDEMSIREHVGYDSKSDKIIGFEDLGRLGRTNHVANHALVFMTKGLRKKWKQPLAFYFSRGSIGSSLLVQLLNDVLRACDSVGLRVFVIVCDMGANNVKALKLMGATMQKPYFLHDNHKIVTVFDPPHLLKCSRNMLYKHDVRLKVKIGEHDAVYVASWQHIREAYKKDKEQPLYQHLHKLTESHMDPSGNTAMKVSTAAQVLSHTVAATISGFVATGAMGTPALGTAKFVGMMNEVFDSMNGSSIVPSGAKGLRCQVRKRRESLHLNFWADAASEISRLQFLKVRQNGGIQVFRPPSQDGWIVSIRGMKLLWEMLKSEGYTFMEPRAVNQDPIEHFFGSVRSHCGSNCNPTVTQFISAVKACMVNGLAFRDIRGANCEEEPDPGSLLNNLRDFLSRGLNDQSASIEVPTILEQEHQVSESDDPIDTFSLAYVSGFVARKLLAGDHCDNCKSAFISPCPDEFLGITFHEYSEKNIGLTYPSMDLVRTVGVAATTLEDVLAEEAHVNAVKDKITVAIIKSTNFKWIKDHCEEHSTAMINGLVKAVCAISIPWWCKKRNR